jgi:hypothetical protein
LTANASTADTAGALVTGVSTQAGAAGNGVSSSGTSVALAQAAIGGTPAAYVSNDQVVALETGAPTAASTSAILAANPVIASAFGASPSFFTVGELGGGHSSVGTASQTATSEIDFSVDLTQLSPRQDLMVGLYHPTVVAGGFTNLAFDIFVNGSDVIHQVFNTTAAATAYFSNKAIDLGSLANGDSLSVRAVMSVTSSAAGGGFDAGLIFGDPLAAPIGSAAVQLFGQYAAAGVSNAGTGNGGGWSWVRDHESRALLLATSAQ